MVVFVALLFHCWCFLDGLVGPVLFIGSHPCVDQATPGGMRLDTFLPGVKTEATALHGDLQTVLVALLLTSMGALGAFRSP